MGDTEEAKKLRWEKQRFFITAIGGSVLFLIGLWQFTISARNGFAQPVLQRQLDLCIEAAGSAAELANMKVNGMQRLEASAEGVKFLSLYFGRLGVVENQCVYNAMLKFHERVFRDSGSDNNVHRLALKVGFACRQMISRNWSPGLVALYDPQFLIENFTNMTDYSSTIQSMPGCEG